jgi:Putative zinc-finger
MTTIDDKQRWTQCPPGSLTQVSRRLRARRRSKLMCESAALVVFAAVIGFTAGYFASPVSKPAESSGPYHFAGIGCNDVRSLLPALMENRLDAAKAMQIRQHIMQCPDCGRLMEQMRASQTADRARQTPPRLVLASVLLSSPLRDDEL